MRYYSARQKTHVCLQPNTGLTATYQNQKAMYDQLNA